MRMKRNNIIFSRFISHKWIIKFNVSTFILLFFFSPPTDRPKGSNANKWQLRKKKRFPAAVALASHYVFLCDSQHAAGAQMPKREQEQHGMKNEPIKKWKITSANKT